MPDDDHLLYGISAARLRQIRIKQAEITVTYAKTDAERAAAKTRLDDVKRGKTR